MGNRKTGLFRGPMSPQQIADGMNAVARNALRLHEDAKLMLAGSRYPSACMLAVLSVEEAGKVPILRQLACAKDKQAANKAWRAFSDHREKNAHWIFSDEVRAGAQTLSDFNKLYDRESSHPEALDTVKQIALYVDCHGEGHWSEPDVVIDEVTAAAIVRISGVMLPKTDVTLREIELWIEHLGSDWNNRIAVRKYYAFEKAMIEEGLSAHTLEDIARFLGVDADLEEAAALKQPA
jgi:AbiV family abortive infection protein